LVMMLKDILYSLIEDGPFKEVMVVDNDGFLIESVGDKSSDDIAYIAAIVRDVYHNLKKVTTSYTKSLPIQGIFETTKGSIIFSFFPNSFTLFGISKDKVKIKDVWNSLAKVYKSIAEIL